MAYVRKGWLDLTRGLAVMIMFVAIVAPLDGVAGPARFVAGPLFAVVIGISLAYSWAQQRVGTGRWLAGQVARGGMLIVLGVVLDVIHDQVVMVLQVLGVVTILAAALVPVLSRRPWLGVGAALALSMLSPLVGPVERVVAFLGCALVGLALAEAVRRTGQVSALARLVAGLTVASLLAAAGRSLINGIPLANAVGAHLGSLLVAATVVVWAVTIERALGGWRAGRVLAPVIATGRLALTAYAIQLVVLAVVTELFLAGGVDDGWGVLATLVVAVVGSSWMWQRRGLPGPLETVVRLPQKLIETGTLPVLTGQRAVGKRSGADSVGGEV